MHKRIAKFAVPLAMLSAAVLAVATGLASASGNSTGGTAHFYEADINLAGHHGTVVLTGAITDYGTDCQGCAGADGLNVLHLQQGTFEINVNDLGNKLASFPLDPGCSSDGSATAPGLPVPIVSNSKYDTGAYTHIQGTFYATGSAALILPQKNGACDTTARQYPGVLIANGSGTVSLQP